jgi:hypothetical protein
MILKSSRVNCRPADCRQAAGMGEGNGHGGYWAARLSIFGRCGGSAGLGTGHGW